MSNAVTPGGIMAKRKEVVRRAIEASDRGDQERAKELRLEAAKLMFEADQLIAQGKKFTAADAYGLMGS